MFLPIASRIGLPRAKASSVPPTMKVSVPFWAPMVPPETGASSMARPAASAAAVTTRALSTSMVEQSISSGLAFLASPPRSGRLGAARPRARVRRRAAW